MQRGILPEAGFVGENQRAAFFGARENLPTSAFQN
jgi:hypothetical protein